MVPLEKGRKTAMDCRDARRVIQEYLDGEATEEDRRELSTHVERCPDCNRHLREMSRIAGSLDAFGIVDPGDAFVRDVMRRVRLEKRADQEEVPTRIGGFRWMVAVMAWAKGAAAMALVILAFGMLSIFVPSNSLEARVLSTDPTAYILVSGRDVQVPPTSTVRGNLTVVDGNLVIWGKVEGDVRIIRGTVKSSSGATVGGRVVIIESPLAQAKDAVLGAVDWFLSMYGRLVTRGVTR